MTAAAAEAAPPASAPAPPSPAQIEKKVAGSSFYLAMRILPKARREAMFAVYAFCREVDDIADDQTLPAPAQHAALQRWRSDLASLYAGGAPGLAALVAEAAGRFGLRQADFAAVIDGMAMDIPSPEGRGVVAPDWATLDLYCDRVASAVGRLSVRVFGMEDGPGDVLAHHLGRALQLTNILRDLDEDAAIGRLYLPREALEAAGIAGRDPLSVVADPRIDAVARAVADRAHAHYREAAAILARRPKGRLAAPRLMGAVYARILERTERLGWASPRRRVGLGKLQLAWIALRSGVAG